MRMTSTLVVGSAVLFLVATSAPGQIDATTRALQDVTLAFTVSGRITALRVASGEKVQAGQILVELDDTEPRVKVDLHRLAADSNVALRLAMQRLELAKIEQDRSSSRVKNNRDSTDAQAERQLADLELEQVQLQIDRARLELRLAEARLEQYALRAPFDGTIARIDVSIGQVVAAKSPVLRLIRSDELWVDAKVPTEQTYDLQTGASAWVTSKRGDNTAPIEGRIEELSLVIDPQTDTRVVRVRIPNRISLLVGAHVTVAFAPPSSTASASQPQPLAIADHASYSAAELGLTGSAGGPGPTR